MNVQFQKISIPPPQKVSGNPKGEGVAKSKVLKEKCGGEGSGGGGWLGVQTQKLSMDVKF